MASFESAINKILRIVDGYSDTNGISYRGITKRQYPKWEGWALLSEMEPAQNQAFTELDESIKEWYRSHFWEPLSGDDINDQEVATAFMDWVAFSKEAAIKGMQKILGAKQDGKMDDDTLLRMNSYKDLLLKKITEERINQVQLMAMHNERYKHILSQWVKRIKAYS